MRELTVHVPSTLTVAFALPLVTVHHFGSYGLGPVLTLLAVFGSSGGLLAVAFMPRRAGLSATSERLGESPPAQQHSGLLALCALALLAALSWPLVFSSDVATYAAYGSQAAHGLDPFSAAAQTFRDPFVRAALWTYAGHNLPICIYGPFFVLFTEGVVRATHGFPIVTTLTMLRLAASVTFFVPVLLLDRLTRTLDAQHRTAALDLYALNPVAVWAVAEGHNDIYPLTLTMLGVMWALRGKSLWGGIAIGITPLLKLPFVIAAPPVALYLWGRGRARDALLLLAGWVLALAIAAAFLAPHVHAQAGLFTGERAGHGAPTVTLLPIFALIAVVTVVSLHALWRGEVRAFLWLGAAAFVATVSSWPWYAVWILPLAAAIPAGAVGMSLWASTLLVTYRYVIEATIQPANLHLSQVNSAAKVLPLLLGFAVAVRSRRSSGGSVASATAPLGCPRSVE